MNNDISVLSERDKELIANGLWPVDVAEPRRLNEAEVARLTKKQVVDVNGVVYEPWVCNGYLMWKEETL